MADSRYEKWLDGINKAVGDPKWNTHDCEIRLAVNEINLHLRGTPNYRPLDWLFVKAMLWVESGAASPQWKIKPMQIGVSGDPGLDSLLTGNEGGDLVLPPAWKKLITAGSARTIPAHNIRAGIGYLQMRHARYEHRTVIDADNRIYEVQVRPGDSLDRIARRHGSTAELMKRLNPSMTILRPGQTVKYQKATVGRVITGWQPVTSSSAKDRYNGNRDPNYARKLDFVFPIIAKGVPATCAH